MASLSTEKVPSLFLLPTFKCLLMRAKDKPSKSMTSRSYPFKYAFDSTVLILFTSTALYNVRDGVDLSCPVPYLDERFESTLYVRVLRLDSKSLIRIYPVHSERSGEYGTGARRAQ